MNNGSTKNRLWLTVRVLFGLMAVVLAGWLWHHGAHRDARPRSNGTAVAKSNGLATKVLPKPMATASPKTLLQEFAARLDTATEEDAVRLQLAELHATLATLPTQEAVTEIRGFLDSHADAPTGLGFKVAAGGGLDEAPTLRAFLLDELARLDPVAAGEYARVILASSDSPDEWALALRNLALGDPSAEGRTLMEQKTGELLEHEPWRQAPSAGFLEAFDVAVYLGGTKFVPTLAEMVRQSDNPATAHASFLALDRLVINDPVSTLAALRAAPDLMQGRELTRGNLFARGDVRDAQQRRMLEDYVRDPKLNPVELEAFAGTFPNANYMISANLLTQNQTLDRAALVERDAESLRVVQQWLTDPTLVNRRPALERTARRLQDFVDSASSGP